MRNSFGEKSPTVRLQMSRPDSARTRISPEIFRISEPVRPSASCERLRSSQTGRVVVIGGDCRAWNADGERSLRTLLSCQDDNPTSAGRARLLHDDEFIACHPEPP